MAHLPLMMQQAEGSALKIFTAAEMGIDQYCFDASEIGDDTYLCSSERDYKDIYNMYSSSGWFIKKSLHNGLLTARIVG